MEKYFSFHWRNPGHWDVSNGEARIFAVRGEGREIVVRDERERHAPDLDFKSLSAAVLWIADELMQESQP